MQPVPHNFYLCISTYFALKKIVKFYTIIILIVLPIAMSSDIII